MWRFVYGRADIGLVSCESGITLGIDTPFVLGRQASGSCRPIHAGDRRWKYFGFHMMINYNCRATIIPREVIEASSRCRSAIGKSPSYQID